MLIDRYLCLILAIVMLTLSAAANAMPQNRYIAKQSLDADALKEVSKIALLEIPDPEAYYYAGGKPGAASMFLGVIGTIAEVAEMGKNADQYPGVDFAQSLQAYLEQFLSENNYRIVDHAIQRRDRFDLLDEYSSLEVAGADAYLDVALVEVGYLYEPQPFGADIKPVATAIVRLVSAETLQVIFARTFQYGYQVNIHSEAEHILPPESHVYESKNDLDLDKPRAIERLDRALEVIAFNIARSLTSGGFVSYLSPTMEDVSNTKEDQAAVEFLGAAATEVAMKTYDKKLWQQSGELAGGDAQKQTEFYIKLRSKRLADEEWRRQMEMTAKLVSEIAASPVPVYDISGSYTSKITGGRSNSYLRLQKKKEVKIKQDGDKITGTFGAGNEIEGTIENDTIVFEWYGTWDNGKGTWKIQEDGKGLRGNWSKQVGGPKGEWNLSRLDSTPIAIIGSPGSTQTSTTVPPGAFNLTGTYHSNKSEYKIVQTGNQIKGYYGNFGSENSTGQIWGEIEGNTVKLEYYDPGGSTGIGELTLSPDGSEWRGTWISTNRKHKGQWILRRVASAPKENPEKSSTLISSIAQKANQPGGAENATDGKNFSGDIDISGTYLSDITTNNNWRFKKAEDRRLKITISQNGNEITGTNKSKNLKIIGVIEGDEISYFTLPSDISSDEIKGKWRIHPDGVSLTGKWMHHNGGGTWDLTRIE